MTPIIRPIRPNEVVLLADFLYEAIYRPDTEQPLPRDIIRHPDLRIYIDDFGQQDDDICLVAETEGRVVDAVWIRLIHACGFVDETTPELAVSLYPAFRNKGIGSLLMQSMLQLLKQKGYAQISLSVSKNNKAVRLYKRFGFRVVEEREEDYLMVCPLAACRDDGLSS